MEKSRDAFRTISEVADLLGTPAHVLRFWESRFPQIRPVKRAGGRRYYRPSDVALLSGIKRLLHGDGLTIRGVQKVLRENGIRHVMALAEGPITGDMTEGTPTGDEALPVAEVVAFPDPAAGRKPPGVLPGAVQCGSGSGNAPHRSISALCATPSDAWFRSEQDYGRVRRSSSNR